MDTKEPGITIGANIVGETADDVIESITVYGRVDISYVTSAIEELRCSSRSIPNFFKFLYKLCLNSLTDFLYCGSIGSRIARCWGLGSLTSVPMSPIQPISKSKGSFRSECRDRSRLFHGIIILFYKLRRHRPFWPRISCSRSRCHWIPSSKRKYRLRSVSIKSQ